MKKGFISIFTLLVFLTLTLTITFIYQQNENTDQYTKNLYNKKQAQYLAETVLNIYINENIDHIKEKILEDNCYQSKDVESHWILENEKVSFKGHNYYLKVAHMYRVDRDGRYDDPKLSDVYRIETSKIEVGYSIGSANAIFKVIDSDDISEEKDIKLMAKYTY